MRRLGGPCAVLVLVAIAASPASAASTRAEYIAQADPICATALQISQQQRKPIVRDLKAARWKSAARHFRVVLRGFTTMIGSLSALQPVPADASIISQWLDGLRAQVPLAKSVAAAMSKHDLRKLVRRDRQLGAVSARTQDLITLFGFQVCNQA